MLLLTIILMTVDYNKNNKEKKIYSRSLLVLVSILLNELYVMNNHFLHWTLTILIFTLNQVLSKIQNIYLKIAFSLIIYIYLVVRNIAVNSSTTFIISNILISLFFLAKIQMWRYFKEKKK